jgi:hypothetical protein
MSFTLMIEQQKVIHPFLSLGAQCSDQHSVTECAQQFNHDPSTSVSASAHSGRFGGRVKRWIWDAFAALSA